MKLVKALILGSTVSLISSSLYAVEIETLKPAENGAVVTTETTTLKSTEHKIIKSEDKGILASVAVIDKQEIILGVVATNKKPSSDVADYAKMMIDQHGSNLTQILEMANKTVLTGGESEKLMNEGKKEIFDLGAIPSGMTFDKAYIDAMVKGHQAALDLIDNKLLKETTSEDIKKFLTDTRAVVANHLEHAKKIQERMRS